MNTQQRIAIAFLALPSNVLPSVDGAEWPADGWAAVRCIAAGDFAGAMAAAYADELRLHAHADGWREGRTLRLTPRDGGR